MGKWIELKKSTWNLSVEAVLFDNIVLFAGRTDHWGIGVDINFYDKSLTFEIFNLYAGIQFYSSAD